MISGNRSRRIAAFLTAALLPWILSGMDTGSLLERIKVAAPSSIAFTEIRFSRMLKQPLIVSGRMAFLGAGQLDRTIESPYRESTEIRGSLVKVRRDGERERTFALDRAPELRTLLQTFSGILTGDSAALDRDFQSEVRTDPANSNVWRLALQPRDARIQRRLKEILLTGIDKTPRCFAVFTQDEGASILMLAGNSTEVSPPVVSPVTQDSLLKHCASARVP